MATLSRFAPQLALSASTALAASSHSASSLLPSSGALIGMVQQYSNIHGNAITVRFKDDAITSLSSSSSSSPSHFLSSPLTVGALESAVLEEWFSKLAEPRFRIHKDSYSVPLDDVEKQIGVINTAYHSVYVKNVAHHDVGGAVAGGGRPFAGSAEFTRLPHRQELNFSVTLWDAQRRPLTTTTWTGPKGNSGGGPMGLQMSSAQVEMEEKSMKRVPLSFPPAAAAADSEKAATASLTAWSGDEFSAHHLAFASSSFRATKNGGFSVQVVPPASASAVIPQPRQELEQRQQSDGEPPPLMPSTVHDYAIALFATNVWNSVVVNYLGLQDGEDKNKLCTIVAKTATLGAVSLDAPFELRSAPPLFANKLRSKPWDISAATIGLPQLRGQRCLALRIETIQNGSLAGVGTYYFAKL